MSRDEVKIMKHIIRYAEEFSQSRRPDTEIIAEYGVMR